jgi:hypothetical protein
MQEDVVSMKSQRNDYGRREAAGPQLDREQNDWKSHTASQGGHLTGSSLVHLKTGTATESLIGFVHISGTDVCYLSEKQSRQQNNGKPFLYYAVTAHYHSKSSK